MRSHVQVARAFARGEAADGGHLYSVALDDGAAVLYSYTTPVAYRGDDGVVRFDERRYTRSTSVQVAKARREAERISGDVEHLPHEDFRAALRAIGASLTGAR